MSVRDLKFKRGRGWLFWLTATLLGLFVLSVALGFGFRAWLKTGQPERSGVLTLPAFDAPVEIRRDTDALVSIRAQSRLDAYRALGVVHAQDRLFQMEMMRRSGSGRLAELLPVGPIVDFDKLTRTLGLRNKAEEDWAAAGPDLRAVAQAYADGVNAFLQNRPGPLPIEFQLLGLEPEPWTPVDSLVWAQIMSLQLSGNWTYEARRARLLSALNAED
ncbi:MAG: penicillin acylase family protein, partial [Pseudomonadota bacterium]